MTEILELKKQKPLLSPEQRKFDRLKKKVENLKKKINKNFKYLEMCLTFYNEQVEPEVKQLTNALSEILKIFYSEWKEKKGYSKDNLDNLRQLIIDRIHVIKDLLFPSSVSDEIQVIFKELTGAGIEELSQEKFHNLKQDFSVFLEKNGVNIDLTDFAYTSNEEEFLNQFEAIIERVKEKIEENNKSTPKSKKQITHELKAKELEELQKNGLNALYKKLAKLFHPDLEQDIHQKAKKELLMKRLVEAYEKKDLHTILDLELEWVASNDTQELSHFENRITIYNKILQNQVKMLEEEIQTQIQHPRFIKIQPVLEGCEDLGIFRLRAMQLELIDDCQSYNLNLNSLRGPRRKKTVLRILDAAFSEPF